MIDPLIHVLWILTAIILSSLIEHRYRPTLLAALGIIFLAIYASGATVFIGTVVLEAFILHEIFARLPRSSKWRQYGAYALLLNLLFVDFQQLMLGFYVDTVGVSFSIIRIFMTTKQFLGSRKDLQNEHFEWILISAYYLPAIIVGPIFSGMDLRKQALSAEKKLGETSYLYRYMAAGLVLAALVAPLCEFSSTFVIKDSPNLFLKLFGIVPLFLMLFAAFWGQSLIAEMSSRIMGYSIPANFNKPWLATDIRDFWKRWHISMAQFVMQYIYLPLTLKGISPKIATIAAFVFMGLWHEIAVGYLIWGVSHGLLMAYWPTVKKQSALWKRLMGRGVTLGFVVVLSFVANYT